VSEAGQPGARAMRRDARERREALIAAAEACFRESGYLVPLERVAARAGVGRGTLYRNFKDRMALALAVFEREAGLAEDIDPALPLEEALETVIRRGALGSALFNRLAVDMPMAPEDVAAFKTIKERALGILAPVVERAKRGGLLASSVEASDVLIAARMVSGLILQHMNPDQIGDEVTVGVRLVMDGLRAR